MGDSININGINITQEMFNQYAGDDKFLNEDEYAEVASLFGNVSFETSASLDGQYGVSFDDLKEIGSSDGNNSDISSYDIEALKEIEEGTAIKIGDIVLTETKFNEISGEDKVLDESEYANVASFFGNVSYSTISALDNKEGVSFKDLQILANQDWDETNISTEDIETLQAVDYVRQPALEVAKTADNLKLGESTKINIYGEEYTLTKTQDLDLVTTGNANLYTITNSLGEIVGSYRDAGVEGSKGFSIKEPGKDTYTSYYLASSTGNVEVWKDGERYYFMNSDWALYHKK